VNEYVMADENPVPVAKVDPALEEDQVRRVQGLRSRRNAAEQQRALKALDDAAAGSGNLVGPIVGAVKAMATVGEIADVLRKRFGEYDPGA
jgi:methylmalonyl-CoA mutase N-terminal domain/subunit